MFALTELRRVRDYTREYRMGILEQYVTVNRTSSVSCGDNRFVPTQRFRCNVLINKRIGGFP